MSDKKYAEIESIFAAIDHIKQEHGLSEDEDWSVGEGPDEYVKLNKDFEIADEKRLIATFREFGLHDLADMLLTNRAEYDRLRERGRRSVHHAEEEACALLDLVKRYAEEARKAASAGAYLAAVTSLGAGVEGLLLNRCLRSRTKAKRIVEKLSRRLKPHYIDDPSSWTFETLIDVCLKAGWLPSISTSIAIYNSASLANHLRLMRNYVHPGRCVRKIPGLKLIDAIMKPQRQFT